NFVVSYQTGSTKSKTDANGTTTYYSYNDNNQLIFNYNNDTGNYTNWYYNTSTQTYDKGKLNKITMSNTNNVLGDTTLSYNFWGKLSNYNQTIGGVTYGLGYVYDNRGRVIEIQYPGGNKAHYTYNTYGEIN